MPKTPWADRYRAAPTNKSNVMRTIILEGPISRAALAKRVGLSLPSVMTITENLINRGLVRAVGKGKSSGGKPPELLSVVPESEYYMGVDIGRGTIRLVLMNLAQKVVYGTMVETGEVQPVEAFVDWLCERIQSSLLESGVALDRLAGVGVAMPGLIERDTGHILLPGLWLERYSASELASEPAVLPRVGRKRQSGTGTSGEWLARGWRRERHPYRFMCQHWTRYRCSSDAEQSALLRQQRHQR